MTPQQESMISEFNECVKSGQETGYFWHNEYSDFYLLCTFELFDIVVIEETESKEIFKHESGIKFENFSKTKQPYYDHIKALSKLKQQEQS